MQIEVTPGSPGAQQMGPFWRAEVSLPAPHVQPALGGHGIFLVRDPSLQTWYPHAERGRGAFLGSSMAASGPTMDASTGGVPGRDTGRGVVASGDGTADVGWEGRILGVSARYGFHRFAVIEGRVWAHGQTRKWYTHADEMAWRSALVCPPVAGEVDLRTAFLVAGSVALGHGVVPTAPAGLFSGPTAEELAYRAARAARAQSLNMEAVDAVRAVVPADAEVTQVGPSIHGAADPGMDGYWAWEPAPAESRYVMSGALALRVGGEFAVRVTFPDGSSVRLRQRRGTLGEAPEWAVFGPAQRGYQGQMLMGGTGCLPQEPREPWERKAPDWIAPALRALRAIDIMSGWPMPLDGRPD